MNHLRNLVLTALFFIPRSSCMDLTIRTCDKEEYSIPQSIALISETIKNMKEDAENADAPIDLSTISKEQFDLLLPAMRQLAHEKQENLGVDEELIMQRKGFIDKLSNKQLIEFIAGAAYLEIGLVETALEVLAQRILSQDEWELLEKLGNMLIELWHIHPARKILFEENMLLEGKSIFPGIECAIPIESKDEHYFMSQVDCQEATKLILLDKNNLTVATIIDEPLDAYDGEDLYFYESKDGARIFLECDGNGIVKVWNKNNLKAKPTTLKYHCGERDCINGIIQSADSTCLISWESCNGTITLWDTASLKAHVKLMLEGVVKVIESQDGRSIISFSLSDNNEQLTGRQLLVVLLWDKSNLVKPVIIEQRKVNLNEREWIEAAQVVKHDIALIESKDDNHIFLKVPDSSFVKVWDKNNLEAGPAALHLKSGAKVRLVHESEDAKNIILFSRLSDRNGPTTVWDRKNLQAAPLVIEGDMQLTETAHYFISYPDDDSPGAITAHDKNDLNAAPIVLHQKRRAKPIIVIESKDGRNIIVLSYGTIRIWDTNDLKAEHVVLKRTKPEQLPVEQMNGYPIPYRSTDSGGKSFIYPSHSFIESEDGNYLISWSEEEGTIRVWDRNNLKADPFVLHHKGVSEVVESATHLITWTKKEGTIRVWDKNDLQAQPIELEHKDAAIIVPSKNGRNIISIGEFLKVWDLPFLKPDLHQIVSLLGIYYETKGNQQFDTDQKSKKRFEIPGEEMLHSEELPDEHPGDSPKASYENKDEQQLAGAQEKKRKEIENGMSIPAKKMRLSQESPNEHPGEFSEELKARLRIIFDDKGY